MGQREELLDLQKRVERTIDGMRDSNEEKARKLQREMWKFLILESGEGLDDPEEISKGIEEAKQFLEKYDRSNENEAA